MNQNQKHLHLLQLHLVVLVDFLNYYQQDCNMPIEVVLIANGLPAPNELLPYKVLTCVELKA